MSQRKLVVKLENVWKVYRTGRVGTIALRNVNLDISKGEFIAVVGPSGSGKTTLINIIAGLDKPSKGRVWVLGRDLGNLDEDELSRFRRGKIGFIFQQFHLIGRLTALENVEIPLMAMGLPPKEKRKVALKLLREVGLGDRADHKPFELSGGEQQRVAIARALAANPELILADEPTGNLDSKTAHSVISLLKNVCRSRRVTVVLVTHNHELLKYADRIAWLKDGGVIKVEWVA